MKVRQIQTGRVSKSTTGPNQISGFGQDTGINALSSAANSVAKDFERAQLEIDQTYAEEARLSFDKDITSIFHDADTGYFNTSGKTAYEQQADTMKRVEAARDAHAKKLSPSQASMYKQVTDKMIASGQKSVMTHGSRGRKAWDVATQEAVVENSIEKATLNFQNDGEIDVQLATLRNSIKTSASNQGVGPEATNERLQTGTSKFFLSVLGKAIEDDSERAGEIFDKVKQHLEPSDLSKVQKALKTTQNKESAFAKADEWMNSGLSVSEGMAKASKIKDPTLREATENRFRNIKAIESTEKKRIQSEANEEVLTGLVDGTPLDQITPERWDAMSASAKKGARAIEAKRLKDIEDSNDKAQKEKYQKFGKRVFSGESWDTIKDDVSDLPLEHQKAIKTLSLNNAKLADAETTRSKQEIKQLQDEAYEAQALVLEHGTRYADIPLEQTQHLTASQRNALAAIDRRINPVVKAPKPVDDLTAVFEYEELMLQGDYTAAKNYLTENPELFPNSWTKNLQNANKALKNPENAKDIKSFLTDKQRINSLLKQKLNKGADKDVAKQYEMVSGAYGEWYEEFQRTSPNNALPTVEERKAKIGKLIVALEKDEIIGSDGLVDDADEYQDSLQKLALRDIEEAGKAEIGEINTLNGVRRARGLGRLSSSDIQTWRTEGKEAALRNVYIRDTVKETGLSETLIRNQVGQESRFKRSAKSYTGVRGLHQITRATAEQYGFDADRVRSSNPGDEEYQWQAYSAIMKDMKRQFKTDKGALLAYNAGPTNARLMLAGKKPRPIMRNGRVVKTSEQVYKEGVNYVKKIMRIK